MQIQVAELERKHPERTGRQWMPWACDDDPLALEHWGLVQKLLNLKWERPSREISPEQIKAMQAGRQRRQTAPKTPAGTHFQLQESTISA